MIDDGDKTRSAPKAMPDNCREQSKRAGPDAIVLYLIAAWVYEGGAERAGCCWASKQFSSRATVMGRC
jgi:hypothetical protein